MIVSVFVGDMTALIATDIKLFPIARPSAVIWGTESGAQLHNDDGTAIARSSVAGLCALPAFRWILRECLHMGTGSRTRPMRFRWRDRVSG
jgi:hypothetical protein